MMPTRFSDTAPPEEDEPEDGVEYLDRRENGCRALLDKRGHWDLPMVCNRTRANDTNGSLTSYCKKHLLLYTNRPQQRKS
jgi:hypothetical protein